MPLTLKPIKTLAIANNNEIFTVSPQGNAIIYGKYAYPPGDEAATPVEVSLVAAFNNKEQSLPLNMPVFVDEQTLLGVAAAKKSKALQLWRLQKNRWSLTKNWPLPDDYIHSKLNWFHHRQSWQLTGYNLDGGYLLVAGKLSEQKTTVISIPQSNTNASLIWTYETLLKIQPDDATGIDPSNMYANIASGLSNIRSMPTYQLWRSRPDGWQRFAVTSAQIIHCLDHANARETNDNLVCLYKKNNSTRLGYLNAKTGQLLYAIELENNRFSYYVLAGKSGNVVALTNNNNIYLVNIKRRLADILNIDYKQYFNQIVAFNDNRLAVQQRLKNDVNKKKLLFFNVDQLNFSEKSSITTPIKLH